MDKEKNYCKNCPECGISICYSRKDSLKDSITKNSKCRKCSKKGTKPKFLENGTPQWLIDQLAKTAFKKGQKPINIEARKGKTLEEIYGDKKAKEILEKYKARINDEESNRKRSESCKKAGCGLSNKGRFPDEETRKLISEAVKSRTRTEEHNRKIRLSNIKNIEENLANGFQITPRFNPKGCDYLDKLMLEQRTFIQHAMNGGEFYIKELGYWVDGYDKENNVVYEYDERKHFKANGELQDKDKKRQEEITKFLNCKFIRIKE